MSVSSHVDDATIVNVHLSYTWISPGSFGMRARSTYRAWRQVFYCGSEYFSPILTLRIGQRRKDEEWQYREPHIEAGIQGGCSPGLSRLSMIENRLDPYALRAKEEGERILSDTWSSNRVKLIPI